MNGHEWHNWSWLKAYHKMNKARLGCNWKQGLLFRNWHQLDSSSHLMVFDRKTQDCFLEWKVICLIDVGIHLLVKEWCRLWRHDTKISSHWKVTRIHLFGEFWSCYSELYCLPEPSCLAPEQSGAEYSSPQKKQNRADLSVNFWSRLEKWGQVEWSRAQCKIAEPSKLTYVKLETL